MRCAARATLSLASAAARAVFGLARIENDSARSATCVATSALAGGRGMRGARAFSLKRQRVAGSRVGQLAAATNTCRAVERGLAGVLFRGSPRGSDRFHGGLARGPAASWARAASDHSRSSARTAARCSRVGCVGIPTCLFVHALDRRGCLLIVIAIDCARIEAKARQGFFELADVAAAGSGRHVAKSRGRAAEDKDRTAGCG